MTVAALFVQTNGCYFGLDDVDPWDERRDARLYAGPHPAVGHPPCERWGRYWYGGPTAHARSQRRERGDDEGCFAAALSIVRRNGGVIEHPAHSSAWQHFNIRPPGARGWSRASWHIGDGELGWTCQVEQGHYGHFARKSTWLYAVGCELPRLSWGRSVGTKPLENMSKRQRAATPLPFRDILLDMARSAVR